MNNDIIEKIRKLLALGEHPSTNKYEAALALERVQKLLFEHNLTRADINTGDETPAPAGIGKVDRTEAIGYSWKRHLAGVIATANLCKVIGSSNNTWHLFGTYDNVFSVLEMYNWIVPELERMALQAWTLYKQDGTGQETARRWKPGYFLGATITIRERLQKALHEFEAGPGHALIPYNTALVSSAVKRVFPLLTTTRIRTTSYDGMAAGRRDGNNITFRPQRKLSGVLALK